MTDTTSTAIQAGLDPARVPAHVAIIMDGNGRWARARGKNRLWGHDQGYRTLKNIVYAADALGIRYLTVYGFSSENWRRSQDEVGGLMKLMLEAMRAEIEELIQNRVRVRVSGRMRELPADLRAEFEDAMQRTAHFSGLTFNLAINYGGRAEVVDAVRALAEQARQGQISVEQITEEAIAAHLYAPDIPDPDLLIRTAGELRLSNFLLWETAYSEIYITPTCWPDFDRDHLIAALADYQKRVRKFGAVVEHLGDDAEE
jgi:undecaprenyl diphosphate synthase